jgi:hypothetical protein
LPLDSCKPYDEVEVATMAGQLALVDQKDAVIALAGASTTLAGFALVFLGIVLTRPDRARKLRWEFKLWAGWILIFWLLLLSAGCALAWLYFNAPGSIHVPLLSNVSSGFLYQTGWILFSLTALISYYVVVVTIRATIGRGNKASYVKDDT